MDLPEVKRGTRELSAENRSEKRTANDLVVELHSSIP
jgi:hypothetical protein